MKLAAVICENGLGHFIRTIGVLHAFRQQYPDVSIEVACTEKQLRLTKSWSKRQLFDQPNTNVTTDLLAPSISWIKDPKQLSDGRLVDWEKRLRNWKPLQEADLVLCDNLVGILSIRPDAILMGSFLWADILSHYYPDIPAVRAFAERDYELLNTHRPPMICVDEIAMPGVKERTQAVGVGWFGQERRDRRDPEARKYRLAVLGGATAMAFEQLKSLLKALCKGGDCQLAVPDRLFDRLRQEVPAKSMVPFHFEMEDFEQCDLILCRPGIGTITDAIVTSTPILAFHEEGNIEMEHNARCIEQLGIGRTIGSDLGEERVLPLLQQMLQAAAYKGFVQQLEQRPVNGIEQAVRQIAKTFPSLKTN